MGRKVKHHAELLERIFSRPEWEYLKRHKDFKEKLKSPNKTLADIEKLGALGGELLQGWEDRNPKRTKFKRVGSRTPAVRKSKSKPQKASAHGEHPPGVNTR